MNLKTDDLLFVRPSTNNMHEFVAEENSCFFDICLPNYTPLNHSRRITYFKEICDEPSHVMKGGLTELEYYTTPPKMPVDFEVNDLWDDINQTTIVFGSQVSKSIPKVKVKLKAIFKK